MGGVAAWPRIFCYPRLLAAGRAAGTPPPPLDRSGVELYLRAATALWHGVSLLRTRPGRTILLPAYHCGLELDVLVQAGYRVAFYPVGRDLAIDLDALRRFEPSDIGALYVIHYFGMPQPMAALRALCDERDWELIEDCAQAVFAVADGRPVGSWGDIAIISFAKALPVPLGGALVVNGREPGRSPATVAAPRGLVALAAFDLVGRDLARLPLLDLAPNRRFLQWVARGVRGALGRLRDDDGRGEARGANDVAGAIEFRAAWRDARMPAFCLALLRRISSDDVVARRRANFAALLAASADGRDVVPLLRSLPDGACPGYFPVTTTGGAQRFIAHCRERGIEPVRMWSRTPAPLPVDAFPDVAWLKREVVMLPVHQDLEPAEIARLQACIVAA